MSAIHIHETNMKPSEAGCLLPGEAASVYCSTVHRAVVGDMTQFCGRPPKFSDWSLRYEHTDWVLRFGPHVITRYTHVPIALRGQSKSVILASLRRHGLIKAKKCEHRWLTGVAGDEAICAHCDARAPAGTAPKECGHNWRPIQDDGVHAMVCTMCDERQPYAYFPHAVTDNHIECWAAALFNCLGRKDPPGFYWGVARHRKDGKWYFEDRSNPTAHVVICQVMEHELLQKHPLAATRQKARAYLDCGYPLQSESLPEDPEAKARAEATAKAPSQPTSEAEIREWALRMVTAKEDAAFTARGGQYEIDVWPGLYVNLHQAYPEVHWTMAYDGDASMMTVFADGESVATTASKTTERIADVIFELKKEICRLMEMRGPVSKLGWATDVRPRKARVTVGWDMYDV